MDKDLQAVLVGEFKDFLSAAPKGSGYELKRYPGVAFALQWVERDADTLQHEVKP